MGEFKGVHNHTGILRRVVLCKPTYYDYIPINETAKNVMNAETAVNKDKIRHQHTLLAQAFEDNSVNVMWVEPTPDKPFQNGTRDWGLMTKEGALIGAFLHYERRGETEDIIKCFQNETVPILGRIDRGFLEGGDCIYLDEKTVAIGLGGRSSPAGVERAARILERIGVEVIPIDLHGRWGHLDTVFSIVDRRLAAACSVALPDFFLGFLRGKGFEIIDVPAERVVDKMTLNLVNLGSKRILSCSQNPITPLLEEYGLVVTEIEFDQFAMGGSGPHCNSHEIDRDL